MDLTHEEPELLKSLMSLIRTSNQLNTMDVGFIRSLNPQLGARSSEASASLLELINRLMEKCGTKGDFSSVEDVDKRWRSIEQCFDLLVDKIDNPPQLSSSAKFPSPNISNPVSEPPKAQAKKDYMKLSNNIPKPQLQFSTKVDNSLRPFRPLLTQKPFASELGLSKSLQKQSADEDHENEWFEQPYRLEIANSKFPEPEAPHLEIPDMRSTPFTFVESPKQLLKMVAKLENAPVVAVDVEHHDYRSYLGIVCLIQISGLGEDYVVDALALRSELQILNKIFANPSIVKVLHGARMDIQWLQRDLGVYIVNLFDTYFAAKELDYPKMSLAYLLQRYVNFEARKEFQLADWRFRPLPEELIEYARADTHFLLYIYEQLCTALKERNLFENVVESSRELAAYRYEYPGWNEQEPAWIPFAYKYRIHGHLQRAILIRLMKWRDEQARLNDESTRYIMSPHVLSNICVTKPRNAEGVLACSPNVSPIVKQNATKIAEIVQKACSEADQIDTSVPDTYLRHRRQLGTQETQVDESDNASNPSKSLKNLRLGESDILGGTPRFTGDDEPPKSKIYLGVFDPADLELAKNAMVKQIEQEKREIEPVPVSAPSISDSEENIVPKETQPVENAQTRTQSRKGKQLKFVDNVEEIELSKSVNPLARRTTNYDEPAFDFDGAAKVMEKSHEDSSSFRRFNGKTGPKGAHRNNSTFKKARSFRR